MILPPPEPAKYRSQRQGPAAARTTRERRAAARQAVSAKAEKASEEATAKAEKASEEATASGNSVGMQSEAEEASAVNDEKLETVAVEVTGNGTRKESRLMALEFSRLSRFHFVGSFYLFIFNILAASPANNMFLNC